MTSFYILPRYFIYNMNTKHFLLLFPIVLILLSSCNSNTPQPSATPGPLSLEFKTQESKRCLRDSLCVWVNVQYPVLHGGSTPEVTRMINDTTLALVYLITGANRQLPAPAAFDTVAAELELLLQEQLDLMPDMELSYMVEVRSDARLQNKRYISYEIATEGYTGGAHGFFVTALMTFDLQNGHIVNLPEIIRDTTALRPLLEKGFLEAKQEEDSSLTLADLLLEPEKPLPMPQNYCVTPEGVLFQYNPYEVAPYAVGPTGILLTWEQLGALAERGKWIVE